jgi:ubiquinone/menaquinone biosynthesis C-methylase UbiE
LDPTARYRKSNLRAYDGPLARAYDRSLAVRLLRAWEMDEFVIDALQGDLAGMEVLDVGCGTGRLIERLAGRGAVVSGTDVAQGVLEVARSRLSETEADLRIADAEEGLPWMDRSFDAVTLTGVYHHFTRPGRALAEIRRVLRGGGRLLMVDACFFTPLRQVMNAALVVHPRAGDFRFYGPRSASQALSSAGLHVTLVRRLNWWSYGVVANSPPDSGP